MFSFLKRNDIVLYYYGVIDFVLFAMLFRRFVTTSTPLQYTELSIEVILVMYVVDLLSGILHIFLDTYTGNNIYIIPHAIGFQKHHEDPHEFCTRAIHRVFVEPALPTMVCGLLFLIDGSIFIYSANYLLCQLLFMVCMLSVQLTHFQAHCINHSTLNPLATRVLLFFQNIRVILNTKDHRKHHTTFDTNFCIFNGWANPLVNWYYRWSRTTVLNKNMEDKAVL